MIYLDGDGKILALQETWLVDCKYEEDFYINFSEYQNFLKNRHAHGGRLALFIHDTFRPIFLNNLTEISESLEKSSVSCEVIGVTYLIGNIYRSPKLNIKY